jgi:hypothetical protein
VPVPGNTGSDTSSAADAGRDADRGPSSETSATAGADDRQDDWPSGGEDPSTGSEGGDTLPEGGPEKQLPPFGNG